MIHVLFFRHAVVVHLLGPVDTRVAPFVVYDGHGVRKQVVEYAEGLLREGRRPLAALALHAAQEGHPLHFVEIGIDLPVVGQHPAHTAFPGVGRHAVIDAVVHRHGVRPLLGQAALQVYVVVDDGEITLLEADHAVGAFVHGRQCVGLVAGLRAEALDCKVAERNFALHAAQRDRAVS